MSNFLHHCVNRTFSLSTSLFSVMMKANSFTMWMNVCLAENSIRILSLNSLWAYFYSNNFQIWEKIAFALKQTLKQKKANFWKALSRPRGNHNQRFINSHSEPSSLISKQDISVLKTSFVASNIFFWAQIAIHPCSNYRVVWRTGASL